MRLNESLNLVEVFRTPLCRAIAGHLMLLVVYLWSRTDGVPKYLNLLEHEMNRFKDLLLVSLGFTAIVLAFGLNNMSHAVAQANQNVKVVNQKADAIPVVQFSQWEYMTASCIGAQPSCLSSQLTSAGNNGWELVSVIRGPATDRINYHWDFVLKRPKI